MHTFGLRLQAWQAVLLGQVPQGVPLRAMEVGGPKLHPAQARHVARVGPAPDLHLISRG